MPDTTGTTQPLDDPAAAELQAFLISCNDDAKSLILITSRSDEAWLGDINRVPICGMDDAEVHEFADDLLANKPAAQRRRQSRAFGELLTMLQGHPLSLRLTLPLLERQGPEALIEGLKGQQPQLVDKQRNLSRLDSLDASVAYSLGQLTPNDRMKLAAVSLFEGYVELNILTQLSNQDRAPQLFRGTSLDEWKALLDRITNVGLLSHAGWGCYTLHPALPGFLLGAWRESANDAFPTQWEEAQVSIVQAAAKYCNALGNEMQRGNANVAMGFMHMLRPNLLRFLDNTLKRRAYGSSLPILQTLTLFWTASGLEAEAGGWLERTRSAVEQEDNLTIDTAGDACKLWLFTMSGQAANLLRFGRFDDAEDLFGKVINILEDSYEESQKRDLAQVYHHIGMLKEQRGDYGAAEHSFKKALSILDNSEEDQANLSSIYYHLGTVAQRSGKLDSAETWYENALAIDKEIGNEPGLALDYHQLGMLSQHRRDFKSAEAWYNKALVANQLVGDIVNVAATCHMIGLMNDERGDLEAAETWYKKALAIRVNHGNPFALAVSYVSLGALEVRRGNVHAALDWTVHGCALLPDFPDPGAMDAAKNLVLLTKALGLQALEESWERCAGQPLPHRVRALVEGGFADLSTPQ